MSSMSNPFAVGPIFGTAFLGVVISSWFSGIASLQTFLYLRSANRDKAYMRVMVWILWIFDNLHSVFIIYGVYTMLILNYYNPLEGIERAWSSQVATVIFAVNTQIVNGFFSWRIWTLGRSMPLVLCVAVLGVVTAALIIASTAKSFLEPPPIKRDVDHLFQVAAAVLAAQDLLIAVSQTVYLHNRPGHFGKLRSIVNKLIAYVITTGTLSLFFTMCVLISDILRPGDFYSALFLFILSKIYNNSLLASLNMRSIMQEGKAADQHETFLLQVQPNGPVSRQPGLLSGQSGGGDSGMGVIWVNKSVVVDDPSHGCELPRSPHL